MDDGIILAIGRSLIEAAIQREQLIQQNRQLGAELKAAKEPTPYPPPAS